jgi:hypothetical protein
MNESEEPLHLEEVSEAREEHIEEPSSEDE